MDLLNGLPTTEVPFGVWVAALSETADLLAEADLSERQQRELADLQSEVYELLKDPAKERPDRVLTDLTTVDAVSQRAHRLAFGETA